MIDLKKTADRFLAWFCKPEIYDDVQGDLDELYHRSMNTRARGGSIKHLWAVLSLLRPGIVRADLLSDVVASRGMYRLHVVTAMRNIRRNGPYAAINILGLALGLAACLAIFSYAEFQRSFDADHPQVDQLYRVNQTAIWSPEGGVMASTPPPVARILREEFAEIEASTRMNTPQVSVVFYESSSGEMRSFEENRILAADSNFFDFFHVPLLEGTPESALVGPNKVVVSLDAAKRYFGTTSCLGEVLLFGSDRLPVIVSGVADAQPDNRHFNFDFLWSMPTNPSVKEFDWSYIWTQMATYVRLAPGTESHQLESKFGPLADTYVKPSFSRLGMDYQQFATSKGGWNFYLQPVRDIHLESADIGNRIGSIGDGRMITLLGYVVLMILTIAVLNFINLSTARSSTRHREVGVKKALGAVSRNVASQFLVESIVVVLFAAVLAVPLVYLLGGVIQMVADIDIPMEPLLSPLRGLRFLGLLILLGLVAGLYPATQYSRFSPIGVLRGMTSSSGSKSKFRDMLVVVQFTIAIALMSASLLIHQQMRYLSEKDLGYDAENILVINNASQLGDRALSFRDEVRTMAGVTGASMSMDVPGRGTWEDIYLREGSEQKFSISQYKVDPEFLDIFDIQVVHGRNFNEGPSSDLNGLVINETTAELFGWEDGALGQRIVYPGYPHELKVIGVMEDFHFQSLRQPLGPLMLFHIDSDMWGDQRLISLKYQQSEQQDIIAQVQSLWTSMSDNSPFSYSFYDEELHMQYEDDRRISRLLSIFTGFSIFIAVLGLVGLLAFYAQQRRREIGIRKVLGASLWQLYYMLNRQYLLLFLIALGMAVPLTWRTLANWLETFAYHVHIEPQIFVLSGTFVIVISLISVSYLTLRVATLDIGQELKE